jgi:uncharacterized protein (TIRG00374 family)
MKLDLKTIVGLAVTIASLVWVFWGEDPAAILHHTLDANLPLLLLATLIAVAVIPIRALRWRWLLPASVSTSFPARHAAVAIGFAANNVLPARMGEFARVLVLGRRTGIPLGTVLGSLVLERVFDGLAVIGLLFASMASPSFPGWEVGGRDPRAIASGLALFTGALGVLLLALAVLPERSVHAIEWVAERILPEAFRRPLVDALRAFVHGLEILRDVRLFAIAIVWAFAQWVFIGLSYFLALRAYGIDVVSFPGALFVQSVVSLASAIPAAPGFFGLAEAASKLALQPWNVESERVVSYAIGFHIVGWIAITALGGYYAWKLGMRWSDMQASEEEVEDAVEHDPAIAAAVEEGGRR